MRTERHPHLDTLEHKHRALHAQVDAEEARPAPDSVKLAMLKRELGKVKLSNLNAVVLRDFIDRRQDDGAGGGKCSRSLRRARSPAASRP